MAEQMSEEEYREKLSKMSPEELAAFKKSQCPFCKIIAGEIPATKIFEDKESIAILDINPVANGHMLVMPKEHYPIMPVVPKETLSHVSTIVKALSQCCLKSLAVTGTNIFIANGAAAGQMAEHFMVHIIPREDKDGITNFQLKEGIVDNTPLKQGFAKNLTYLLKEYQPSTDSHTPPDSKPSYTENEILQLIDQNPPLQQAFLQTPQKIKTMIESNSQLQELFKGHDITRLITLLTKPKKNMEEDLFAEEKKAPVFSPRPVKGNEPKEIPAQKGKKKSTAQPRHKKEEDADLDDISSLFS